MNSPCREHSNGGLGIVVALTVHWQINFLSVYTEGPIELYYIMFPIVAVANSKITRMIKYLIDVDTSLTV